MGDLEPKNTATTLAARNEIRGRIYPLYLERVALLFSIGLCTFIGFELVRNDYFSTWVDVLLCILVLPIAALILAELLGRVIQNMIR